MPNLFERFRTRVDQLVVSCIWNLEQFRWLSGLFLLLRRDVIAAKVRWDGVIYSAVDQPLPGLRNFQFHRIGLTIVFRYPIGCATEEFGHSVVAQVQREGFLQIDNSSQRDHAAKRTFVRPETQGELPARGMSHDDKAIDVQVESGTLLPNETIGRADIVEGPGPSAAGVSNAPIFKVKSRDARSSERLAQVARVCQTILCAPEATVNIQQNRMRSFGERQPHLEDLVWIRAIGGTVIGRRLRFAENIFGRHKASTQNESKLALFTGSLC